MAAMLCSLIFVSPASGMQASEPKAGATAPPLELEFVPAGHRAEQPAVWRVRNVSDKDITAYVFVAGPAEEPASCCNQTLSVVHAVAIPGRDRGPLRPGEIREEHIGQAAPGKTARAVLDYVLFGDGTSWGPDTQRHSLYVRGVIHGSRGTYGRLQRILKQEGAQALAQALEAAKP